MKQYSVLNMRPTQFALGMREVDFKFKKLKNMSAKQRKRYLLDRPIQVVIGPKNVYYIVDQHHLVRACWEAGIKKVPVEIKANLKDTPVKNFWKVMSYLQYVHPYDQFGRKQKFELFPSNVRGMSDDPYRSLAWSVREAGGFEKVFIPFSEFKWANYFRKLIRIEDIKSNFDMAVKKALKTCQSGAASNLPGYKS